MTKRFVAQMGSNNIIKVYDATTGSLHRVINVGGEINSQPVVMEDELSVTIKAGTSKIIKIYNVNTGSLKKSLPLQ